MKKLESGQDMSAPGLARTAAGTCMCKCELVSHPMQQVGLGCMTFELVPGQVCCSNAIAATPTASPDVTRLDAGDSSGD